MRLMLRGAIVAVSLFGIVAALRAADETEGKWTAKSHKSTKKDASGLSYRPSKQFEPEAKEPTVARVGRDEPAADIQRDVPSDEQPDAVQTSFVEPAKRKPATATRTVTTVRKTPSPSQTAAKPRQETPQSEPTASYTGAGKLVRGRTKAKDAPPSYALLDEHGKVVCFVSNKTKIDLASLVGKQVKITGEPHEVRGSEHPRVTISKMIVHSQRPAVRQVMLLQEAKNGDAPGATSGGASGATSAKKPMAAAADEAPAFDPQAEDVPPPRAKAGPAPIDDGAPGDGSRTMRAKPRTVMPEPEAVSPGMGTPDGEVYYSPPQIGGEMIEGEIVDGGDFEGQMVDGVEVEGGGPGGYMPRGYRRPYPRGPLEWIFSHVNGGWVRADYLLWTTEGMNTPPLVTTSPVGTPRAAAGVLGESGTSVLFGGNELFDESRSGGRLQAGIWLDPCHVWGIEGEYLALEDMNVHYSTSSNGDAIISRPFFDMINARETAELVSFPNVIGGQIDVDAMTRFQSAGIRLRLNACHDEFACDPCDCSSNCFENEMRTCGLHGCGFDPSRAGYRLDIIGGYRSMRLDDQLRIHESLTSLDTTTPGTFDISDSFDTENRFNGGELGLLFEARLRRWSLELLSRLALGTTQEIVTINGTTTTDEGGDVITENGGLLAQRTNIGRHKTNQFSAVPEVGVTLGYQLTEHIKVNVGYTMVYWSRVARAGDQIDLDVNPNLIPPEVTPLVGPERPQFHLVESDFWAHGLNAGLECRW